MCEICAGQRKLYEYGEQPILLDILTETLDYHKQRIAELSDEKIFYASTLKSIPIGSEFYSFEDIFKKKSRGISSNRTL